MTGLPQPSASPPVRVMIVDDSAVARAVLARIVREHDDLELVGCHGDAGEALDALDRGGADVVLLDIDMPGRDGLSALPDLLFAGRGAAIVVVSARAQEGGVAAVQALALGAAETLAKPDAGRAGSVFGSELVACIQRVAPVDRGPVQTVAPAPEVPSLRPFEVIALSASTGGIHALSQVLRPIPVTMTAPILVTQHLPDDFMPYFASQVALLAGRPAIVAGDGAPVVPGRVLVAPGDAHLTVVRSGGSAIVRLQRRIAPSGCCPSADPMLASLAAYYGAGTLAVTLSGMGRDGAIGAKAVREVGGQVLVQDADSAVVWGMPGAVARAGLADAVLPPAEIGALIARSAHARAFRVCAQ